MHKHRQRTPYPNDAYRVISEPFDTHPNAGDFDDGQRDIWVPLGTSGCMENCGNFLQLVGRLTPGAKVDQARAEVQSLLTVGPSDQIARVVPTKEIITRGFGTPLVILLGAAAVLLLIACANVSGLLIGEATRRQHEISVRSALGASRGRIVRLLLTESVLLGVFGSALGLLLASAVTNALLTIAPALPRLDAIRIDGRVLLFALGAGVGTGVLFGICRHCRKR
jgi:putative ABC transport system permease protein